MAKNIGVLAAVAFVLSTQGVTAATISEARLQELMASTSIQEVSLETLRARDRQILEELGRSLASRYSEVLAGSEMVFTRLSESGTLFYRLDFVGLQNHDRARALCEILEMDRCIARIGNDRLRVLDVRTDPIVSAITIVEEDDTDPFSWTDEEPVLDANPEARDIEARVRAMLNPLRVFPQKRPDLSFYDAVDVAMDQVSATPAPINEEVEPSSVAEPAVLPEAAAISPPARPIAERIEDDQAGLVHPVARPAHVTAQDEPQASEPAAPLFPLARPFEEHSSLTAPILNEIIAETAGLRDASAALEMIAMDFEAASADYIEVADASFMPQIIAPPLQAASAVVRLPGIGEVDMSRVRTSAPQLEVARPVLSGVVTAPAKPGVAMPGLTMPGLDMSKMASVEPRQPATEEVEAIPAVAIPQPLERSVVLAELSARVAAEAERVAFAAGAIAPRPLLREIALADLPEAAPAEDILIAQAPISETVEPQDTPLAAGPIPPIVAPTPIVRELALASIATPQEAVVEETVLAELPAASPAPTVVQPEPMVREVALASLQPEPTEPTIEVARLSASPEVHEEIEPAISMDGTVASALTQALAAVDARLVAGSLAVEPVEDGEAQVEHLADLTVQEAPEAEEAATDLALAAAPTTDLATASDEVAPERDREVDRRTAMAALAVAEASGHIAKLGSVSFDDRYARPASVDFSEGHVAGKLQKLPFRRPDLAGYVRATTRADRPLQEAGIVSRSAMLSGLDEPFEIAQVPMPAASAGSQGDMSAPFFIEEENIEENRPLDVLDQLLSSNNDGRRNQGPGTIVLPPRAGTAPEEADLDAIFGAESGNGSRPQIETQPQRVAPPQLTAPARAPQPAPAADPAAMPPLQLTQEMRVSPPSLPAFSAPAISAPQAPAPVAVPAQTTTFQAQPAAQAAYDARQVEDEAARQRRALETLSQIVQDRQREQAETAAAQAAPQVAAPAAERTTRYAQPEGTMQRRPAPRTELHGNSDAAAAREIAGYEASFSDDRTRMERAANPRGQVSPAERMERFNSLSQAVAPADLRIELSYVGSREAIHARVAELKSFFPPVMMTKGRFFGASVPGQPDRFVVGIAAADLQTRDDIIWYLEQMGLPWAIR